MVSKKTIAERMSGASMLTAAELCARWKGSVSPGTLANWRHLKRGPNYMKFEGSILYPLDEVEKYEKKNIIKV